MNLGSMTKLEKDAIMQNMLDSSIGVLIEDFQHKLAVVAEGVVMVNEKVDRVEKRVTNIEYTVSAIQGELSGIHGILQNHEGRICELEAV